MANLSITGSIPTIQAVLFDVRKTDRTFMALFQPKLFQAVVKTEKAKARALRKGRRVKKESKFDEVMKGFRL